MSEVKPILMDKPEHFDGAHNDIEHFLGDCATYFEVFRRHYIQHLALMVVFASSLFRGLAKDWWVHLRDDFKYDPDTTSDYNNNNNNKSPPFNGGPRY